MVIDAKDLPKFKSPSAFVTYNNGEREGKCGHWGEVDKFGFCLSDDCRADRLIRDLHAGQAKMLPDGTLVWNVEQ